MPVSYVQNQIPTTYGQALSLLVEMLVGAGWTYQASGDGLSGFSSSGKIFTGTGSGALGWNNPGAWARIQDPATIREFVFAHDAAGGAIVKYSPLAKFTSSSTLGAPSATVIPQASDERYLRGAATGTVTISIASPGVITWPTNHGLILNSPVSFTTTGALPTGLTAGTVYFVKTTPTATTFTVSATPGGTAINTSGTQSGTHTGFAQSFGAAWFASGVPTSNGTFYGAAFDTAPYGFWYAGSSNLAVTITIASPGVITWNAHGLNIGNQVMFTTTGALPTNLLPNTTYFISATSFTVNSFTVTATPGGAAINTAGTQSGTQTAYAMRTGLMFDPITATAEDPDPYVLHIGSTNAYCTVGNVGTNNVGSLGRDGGTTGGSTTWSVTGLAPGVTTEGCFAIMSTDRSLFYYVQPAGLSVNPTGSAANGFVINQGGLAANPFNSKFDPLPFPYVRIHPNLNTTVSPGIKGWSSLARWIGAPPTALKVSLLDTLGSKAFICVGAWWLPWDGTTTPIG